MRTFIIYTVLGTLATFGILVYFSLIPHLQKLPSFAGGFTQTALLGQAHAFLMTFAIAWITWWSISGLLSLILYSLGKYTTIVLFVLSLAAVTGITIIIT